MSTMVSIIFPYLTTTDHALFQLLAQTIYKVLNPGDFDRLHTAQCPVVLVVNRDLTGGVPVNSLTQPPPPSNAGIYYAFHTFFQEYYQNEERNHSGNRPILPYRQIDQHISVLCVWSVDTCQMWLSGFGAALDAAPRPDVILQIPGDLKKTKERPRDFFGALNAMSALAATGHDFVVGDFHTDPPHRAKDLIDSYGTYPLLYNWFPEQAKYILNEVKIVRPRSEFIAAKTTFLDAMLSKRKFAYEQTIVFLLHACLDASPRNNWRIGKHRLGILDDFGGDRGFRQAVDQIERTERLLKFMWRERAVETAATNQQSWTREFAERDRRSTSIREAAIVSLQNILEP